MKLKAIIRKFALAISLVGFALTSFMLFIAFKMITSENIALIIIGAAVLGQAIIIGLGSIAVFLSAKIIRKK